MTRQEFAARLAEHGPDLHAWPPQAARAARRRLVGSPACRRLYVQALETDAALGHGRLTEAGLQQLGALCAQVARTPQAVARRGTRMALRGAVLGACVLVGLLVGWYSADAPRAAPLVYAAVDLTPFTGSGE